MDLHSQTSHEQHVPAGAFYAILGTICFTLMSLMTKLIGEGASTDTIVFARYFISLILILPLAIKYPQTFKLVEPVKLIARTIFTLLALASFFYSLRFISLTEALLLNNTSPLFVPLLVLMVYHAQTPHKVWGGILLGFLGIGFVLKPGPHIFHPVALIALASGIFAAIAYVVIRSLTKSLSILQILFYNFLICSLISGLFLPFRWETPDFRTLLLLLFVGIFGSSYQFFSTLSIAKAPVRTTASIQFLSIVLGAVADFFIWKRVPDMYTFIGICLVILGGIITIYFSHKEIKR